MYKTRLIPDRHGTLGERGLVLLRALILDRPDGTDLC